MSEVQDTNTAEFDWTPTALGFARAYYAGALLAARHQPDDLHRRQRAEEAWKEYLEAAEKAGRSLLPNGPAQEQD